MAAGMAVSPTPGGNLLVSGQLSFLFAALGLHASHTRGKSIAVHKYLPAVAAAFANLWIGQNDQRAFSSMNKINALHFAPPV